MHSLLCDINIPHTHIQDIDLFNIHITDETLIKIGHKYPNLANFDIAQCTGPITEKSIISIINTCFHIKHIRIACSNVIITNNIEKMNKKELYPHITIIIINDYDD